jgi:hypothetical protein
MPVETGRAIRRKRIQLPNGSTVDIPVVTQIAFLDVVDNGQESEFHLENGAAGYRDVRVASVPGNGAPTDESGGSDGLKVERVDTWRVLDVVSQGQETDFHPDSKTINPSGPKYFSTHEKTHVVKYINTPDDGNWIKSELIDQWKYADTVDQGQESEYFLFNPPDNAGIAGLTLGTDSEGNPTVAIDPGTAEISDAINPVRTDPFQNIVDFSAPQISLGLVWNSIESIGGVSFGPALCPTTDFLFPPGTSLTNGCTTSVSFVLAPPALGPELTVEGSPTVSVTPPSFGAWTVEAISIFPGSFPGPVHTFNIDGTRISGSGPGCYGTVLGQPGTEAGGYLDGTSSVVATVRADATGVSGATYLGVHYVVDQVTISSAGLGPSIAISFKVG